MAYENNNWKTAVVLNTEFPLPLMMNALGHCTLGLAAKSDVRDWRMLDYPIPSFETHSLISEFPVIVLRAKKSAQLEKLISQASAVGVVCNVFIETMFGRNAAEQQEATRNSLRGRDRIVCVAAFAEDATLRPLIKSLSIYKSSDAIGASEVIAAATGPSID